MGTASALNISILENFWTKLGTKLFDLCLTVHHQLGKVIQKKQLDAAMIY